MQSEGIFFLSSYIHERLANGIHWEVTNLVSPYEVHTYLFQWWFTKYLRILQGVCFLRNFTNIPEAPTHLIAASLEKQIKKDIQ